MDSLTLSENSYVPSEREQTGGHPRVVRCDSPWYFRTPQNELSALQSLDCDTNSSTRLFFVSTAQTFPEESRATLDGWYNPILDVAYVKVVRSGSPSTVDAGPPSISMGVYSMTLLFNVSATHTSPDESIAIPSGEFILNAVVLKVLVVNPG